MKPLNAKLRRKKWWQFWLPPYYLHLVFEVKEKFIINLLKGGETMAATKPFFMSKTIQGIILLTCLSLAKMLGYNVPQAELLNLAGMVWTGIGFRNAMGGIHYK